MPRQVNGKLAEGCGLQGWGFEFGAKAYQVQYCTATGAWLDAGIWPNTKEIVITGLLPGTVYGVRVRGVGGSTQYGPWSATVSLMCT
jgi:hypothetical protein